MVATGAGRIVLRGGSIPAGGDTQPAAVAVEGERITAVGAVEALPDDRVIDAAGRLLLPGFVDAHSHADGMLGDPQVQQALLRQGITTIIAGQDGVSYAPGPGSYAEEYFAAINGPDPAYRGGGVAGYLDSIDGAGPINAAYLIPAGTIRHEVCGRGAGPAAPEQTAAMVALASQGMAEGAVGLSTGLDYVPGIFQQASEIAALCAPVATAGGVYVTHMRGGYEANTAAGIGEIAEIANLTAAATGAELPVHVSHFHADASIVLAQLDALAAAGIDTSFDAYPYVRGCSLLAMPLLPPELSVLPLAEVLDGLTDPVRRPELRAACLARVTTSASLGPDWARMITVAHVAPTVAGGPDFSWAHGLTLQEAATRAGAAPIDFTLDLLAAARLQANAVMAVPHERGAAELAQIFGRPEMMGGSDGIFIGAHPHPRARGSFARYLREYVRECKAWTWADAVAHLATGPAQRFRLGERGVIRPGAVADLILVDPGTVADTATYDRPLGLAVGIDDVLVAGVPVLADGELTGARPGRGLRRSP